MSLAQIRRRLKQITGDLEALAGDLAGLSRRRAPHYPAEATCKRCTHAWVKRIEGKPKYCPACKSPYWDRARGKVRVGRPPKSAGRR